MAMLVSVVLIPVIGLFPLGRRALKQAEDLQTASFLARESMSLARATQADSTTVSTIGTDTVASHTVSERVLNSTVFTITRDLYAVHTSPRANDPTRSDVTLLDVVVHVDWPTMQRPVVLSSRVYKKYIAFQKDIETDEAEGPPTPVPTPSSSAASQ